MVETNIAGIAMAVVLVSLGVEGCVPSSAPHYPPPSGAFARPMPPSAPAWCLSLLQSSPNPIPITELFNRARGLVKSKGEFETTDAFNARAKDALQRVGPALEKVSGTDHVIVLIPLPLASYDADRSAFKVATILGGFWGTNTVVSNDLKVYDFEFVPVTESRRNSGSYIGMNAFGVTKQVQAISGNEYGVALVDQGLSKASWIRTYKDITIPVGPDRAAATNGKLGVVIIGDLAAPGTIEGRRTYEATLSDPTKVVVNQHYVAITSACGGIVTMDNRELLHRLN